MTKPRLRKIGDGWECCGVAQMAEGVVTLIEKRGKTPEEAFSRWSRARTSALLEGSWMLGNQSRACRGSVRVQFPHEYNQPNCAPSVPEPPPIAFPEPRQGWLTRLRNWLAR